MNDDKSTQVADEQKTEDKSQTQGGALRAKLEETIKKNNELSEKLKVYEDQELERKQKQLEEEGKYNESLELKDKEYREKLADNEQKRISAQLEAELIKAGADPESADLLISKAREQITLDSDGNMTNTSEVLNGLKDKYDPIFKRKSSKVGVSVNTGTNKKVDLSKPSNIDNMTHAEYMNKIKNN